MIFDLIIDENLAYSFANSERLRAAFDYNSRRAYAEGFRNGSGGKRTNQEEVDSFKSFKLLALPDRHEVSGYVLDEYKRRRENLIRLFKALKRHNYCVSATTDVWTKYQYSFVSLTISVVVGGKLISGVVDLKSFGDASKNSLGFAKVFINLLAEWELTDVVKYVTADRGPDVSNAFRSHDLCKYKHIPCLPHFLNNLVNHLCGKEKGRLAEESKRQRSLNAAPVSVAMNVSNEHAEESVNVTAPLGKRKSENVALAGTKKKRANVEVPPLVPNLSNDVGGDVPLDAVKDAELGEIAVAIDDNVIFTDPSSLIGNRLVEAFNILHKGNTIAKLQKLAGLNFVTPTSICDSRWHSLRVAMRQYLKMRDAIVEVLSKYDNGAWWKVNGFSSDDEKTMTNMLSVLDLVNDHSDMLSGSKYPTIQRTLTSLVILKNKLVSLRDVLQVDRRCGCQPCDSEKRCTKMINYLETYVSTSKGIENVIDILCAANYLDPCHYVNGVNKYFPSIGVLGSGLCHINGVELSHQCLKSTYERILDEEETMRMKANSRRGDIETRAVVELVHYTAEAAKVAADLQHSMVKLKSKTTESSNIDKFNEEFIMFFALAESLLDQWKALHTLDGSDPIDIIAFWNWSTVKSALPRISRVAPVILGITASSVASERLFSHAGNAVTRNRGKLIVTTGSKLVCLGEWMNSSFDELLEQALIAAGVDVVEDAGDKRWL